MTMPGRIAYFLVLLFLAVLGFSVRLDLWASVIVAAVAMIGVALFETTLSRRRADRAESEGAPSQAVDQGLGGT
ncbi:hypothetical protein AB0M02_16980 [Actinoplanes sp. NPDC051861]|uniref:hypothetical protein n=1 Tax=Actinoplanes sp. NPDC051861 TaxID=3155170 RepID=UPI00341EB65A